MEFSNSRHELQRVLNCIITATEHRLAHLSGCECLLWQALCLHVSYKKILHLPY